MADNTSFRVYQLAVGIEGEGVDGTEHTGAETTMFYVDRLQFTASINYTSEKTNVSSDETTFEIVGLEPDSEKLFKREGATVMLRAGYDTQFDRDSEGNIINDYNSLPVVYLGKIIWATTIKRGVDKVTKIVCSSDNHERDVLKVAVSYKPNTTKASVIKDLVNRTGFSVLSMDLGDIGDQSYPTGLSMYGSLTNALNKVCMENGLMWFTYNQQIRIQPITAKTQNLAWEVSPSQIIDSIESYYKRNQSIQKPVKTKTHRRGKHKNTEPRSEDVSVTTTTDESGNKLKTTIKTGVKFKTFLDGRFKLGDNVVIRDSDQYLQNTNNTDSQFRIIAISHDLNFRQGGWTTELELVSASDND